MILPQPNKPVQTMFDMYIKQIYKTELPLSKTQYDELQKAFFAGVHGGLYEVYQLSKLTDEETAVVIIETIMTECEQFGKEILNKWYQTN